MNQELLFFRERLVPFALAQRGGIVIDDADIFGELRGSLHAADDEDAWAKLCAWVDTFSPRSSGAATDRFIDYAADLLRSRPTMQRWCPTAWLAWPNPFVRLATHFVVTSLDELRVVLGTRDVRVEVLLIGHTVPHRAALELLLGHTAHLRALELTSSLTAEPSTTNALLDVLARLDPSNPLEVLRVSWGWEESLSSLLEADTIASLRAFHFNVSGAPVEVCQRALDVSLGSARVRALSLDVSVFGAREQLSLSTREGSLAQEAFELDLLRWTGDSPHSVLSVGDAEMALSLRLTSCVVTIEALHALNQACDGTLVGVTLDACALVHTLPEGPSLMDALTGMKHGYKLRAYDSMLDGAPMETMFRRCVMHESVSEVLDRTRLEELLEHIELDAEPWRLHFELSSAPEARVALLADDGRLVVDSDHGAMTIGRDERRNLVLRDEDVSRLHALIEPELGQSVLVQVHDLSSVGTRVHGRYGSQLACHMDILEVGTRFVRVLRAPRHVLERLRTTHAPYHRVRSYEHVLIDLENLRILRLNHTVHTLGRSAESDFVFPREWVSREHAQLVRAGKSFRVRDMDSKAGTSVNGRSAVCMEDDLRDLSIISLGKTPLLYCKRRERGALMEHFGREKTRPYLDSVSGAEASSCIEPDFLDTEQ